MAPLSSPEAQNILNKYPEVQDLIHSYSGRFEFEYDENKSADHYIVLRSGMDCVSDVEVFVKELEKATCTNYIIKYKSRCPCKFIYHTTWVCHRSSKKKTETSRRNAFCNASLNICIKKVSKGTKRNDAFLKRRPPLPCEMQLYLLHSHDTTSMLRIADEVKEQFDGLFRIGMTPAEAIRVYSSRLPAEVSAVLKPTKRQIYYLYERWRRKKQKTNDEIATSATPVIVKIFSCQENDTVGTKSSNTNEDVSDEFSKPPVVIEEPQKTSQSVTLPEGDSLKEEAAQEIGREIYRLGKLSSSNSRLLQMISKLREIKNETQADRFFSRLLLTLSSSETQNNVIMRPPLVFRRKLAVICGS